MRDGEDGRGVRFGCGALCGLLLVAGGGLAFDAPSVGWVAAVAIATALTFGALSARFGDRFWERLSSLARWWS